jgi:predicted nucleotidyltransferase
MRKLAKSKLERATKIFLSHGAREVYLFGSQARGNGSKTSDLDFAVVGLPARSFFRAMGEVIEAVGRPVDLVDLDQDTPFTRYLRSNGELVRVS